MALDDNPETRSSATWLHLTTHSAVASSGEVAARLQRQPGWVYQAKFRVVQRLREEIARLSADVAVFNR